MLKKSMSRRAPRKTLRRRRPLRRRLPLSRNPKRVGGPNTCRIETTIPSVPLLVNTPYQFNLAGIVGSRAVDVAPNFALYRVAKVVFKYKPLFDTYRPDSGVGATTNFITSVPTLYWKMNRFADDPNAFTADDLRVMGAKPIRFDDKQYTMSYRPNILLDQATGGSHSGSVKMTPWLNTDSAPDTPNFAISTTQHYGHFWYIQADTVNGSSYPNVGSLDITIFYEFKNPRVEWNQSVDVPQKIKLDGTGVMLKTTAPIESLTGGLAGGQ